MQSRNIVAYDNLIYNLSSTVECGKTQADFSANFGFYPEIVH